MRIRAAALIMQNDSIAVIERHRAGRHYFTFPGGGVESGETPEEAVLREVFEELGLHIEVVRQVAEVWFRGERQDHFLAETTGGTFGTGDGEEFNAAHRPAHGTYKPVWLPVADLPGKLVLPTGVAALAVRALTDGWPEEVVVLHEPER